MREHMFHAQQAGQILSRLRGQHLENKKITENQVGWISHHILQEVMDRLEQQIETRGDTPVNLTLQKAEDWCRSNLDKDMASKIIRLWKEGDEQTVLGRLREAGLKIDEV